MAARHATIAAAGNKITFFFIALLLEMTRLPDVVYCESLFCRAFWPHPPDPCYRTLPAYYCKLAEQFEPGVLACQEADSLQRAMSLKRLSEASPFERIIAATVIDMNE